MISAPASSAARAATFFVVSTEIGIRSRPRNAPITGITRSISSSALTGFDPGLVDSPPTSRMSAPSASISRARETAFSRSAYFPPSENESGVTLSTPITRTRDSRSSVVRISSIADCGGWGVGNGEWVKEVNPRLPIPHSLFPTPLLHKYDFVAAPGVDEFGRRAAPERDLPETRAARIGEQIIPIRRLGEIGAEMSDLAPPYIEFR